MLPCEILVGKHKLLKQLNVKVHSLYNFSKIPLENRCNLRISYANTSINNITRFHTQLLSNCQALPKDPKPTQEDLTGSLENTSKDLKDDVPKNKPAADDQSSRLNLIKSSTEQQIPESVIKWLSTDIEKAPSRDIEKKFPESKAFLHNLYTVVANETKIPHCLTSSNKHVELKKKTGWAFTYNVEWPEPKSFTSVGHSKSSASLSAALKCLYWLELNNRIKHRLPVIYTKQEITSVSKAPEELNVNDDILDKVNSFLEKNEEKIMEATSGPQKTKSLLNQQMWGSTNIISHLKVRADLRNKILQERYENRKCIAKPDLPIFNYKSQILQELKEHQALVIKGDTGCGKTTQVPQFILDDMAVNGSGTDCRMIITQPRRISAISLAQRIASERNENVGDVVGYQVRLQQVLPKQDGAILFCTNGILLKKMKSNPNLEGCSHVIVDEAHERSVDTDMLLVLLRRAMEVNRSLKVIIMSATINADLFQNYLNCNAVEVPGRLFDVKMNFLEDIEKLGISVSRPENGVEENEPFVNCQAITDLIQYISENKPPGAILCFLPGWNHIQQIQTALTEGYNTKQLVIPLHSKLPYITQNQIFDTPPSGVRKIILATDIAETGITVPDVVYVIDCACHKEVRWHESRGLSSIDTHWITRANLNQRKGRAGRVQEGESFHFITKSQYSGLDDYPLPEVLRVSLEQTVLDSKAYSDEKAENFLGDMPQPPRKSAVDKAICDLQILGALDQNQNLTALGRRISPFSIHPKLSKAMVYSTIFQCLNPVTTVSSFLSFDSEIFYGSLVNKSRIRELKQEYHPSSDHLSIAWIYSQWENFLNQGIQEAYRFSRSNRLHAERMMILHKIRNLNLEHLREAGMIDNVTRASNSHSSDNEYAPLDELVRGILLAGMDHILKHRDFEVRKGRFTRAGTSMVMEDDAKAQLTPESVNYKRTSWPSSFAVYYQKTHLHERRTTLIRESSLIAPVTVLLFSQGRVNGCSFKDKDTGEDKVLLQIDGKSNVQFVCNEKTAKTMLRFRDVMWLVVRYYIDNYSGNNETNRLSDDIEDFYRITHPKEEMMIALANLLSSASDSIDSIESTQSPKGSANLKVSSRSSRSSRPSLYDSDDYGHR